MRLRGSTRKVQTTLRLPRPLYEQAKILVESGVTAAATVNDLILAALRAYTKMLNRKRIDAEFAKMAEDTNYQKEAQLICEQFEQSDWEALEFSEGLEEGAHAPR